MPFQHQKLLSIIVLVTFAMSVVVLATGGAFLPSFLTQSLSQLASPVSLTATSFFDDYDTLDFVDEKSLSGVVWDGRSALVFSGSRAGVIGKMVSKRFYTGPVSELSVSLTGDSTSAVAVEVSSDLGVTWCSAPYQSCLKGETFQYRLTFNAPATIGQIMILWRPRALTTIDRTKVPAPSPLLTFWGTFLDAPSVEWPEYLGAVRRMKEDGSITHIPVRVWTPSVDISSRLSDLRALGLPLAFFSSPGHRFLTKPTELDSANHISNNQNLKYFDTPGFDPYKCRVQTDCVTKPHVTAHDPAYTGMVWQKELDHLSASLDRVGLRAGDMVVFDTEVWAEPESGVQWYYPNVILDSPGRYQGTPTERYDAYRSNWLARARDLVAIVRSKVSGAPVLFYGENQPAYDNPGENWMLPGSGDAPAPVFYWLPDLNLIKSKLASATWSNAYPWVSFSFNGATRKEEVVDPLKTQKLGFLLKTAGARGAIVYPGPFDHAVDWNIPISLYLAHTKALADGFLRGLDPDAPPATTPPSISGDNKTAVLFYPSVWADYGYNRTSVNYDNIRDVFRDIKSIGFNSLLIVSLQADRNQVEIDNYVAWLKANIPLAKQEGLSSIVGIPFFYLFDPPKANVLAGYNLEYWNWIKGQDRVALIKQFIDEMSGVAGVTDIYWSVELVGIKNESRGEYLHLNYDLAKVLKDYSNDRGLGLIHLTGSTHSDSYFINADGNFDVMGPNAHEILGCSETGECRYLRNIQRVTDQSILKETEGIYNLEIRGDFRDYPRNQNQGDKQLMTESFARQLTAVKEYKPQHISVYYYDRITPFHVLKVLYPEIRKMLTEYFFATTTPPSISGDKTAPIVSAVTAFDLGQDQVTIAWTTDEPATSQIDYGFTANYGQTTALDKTLVKVRRRTIARLNPGTLYHYRVKSADSAGNLAQSADFTFTTLPLPSDVLPDLPIPEPPPTDGGSGGGSSGGGSGSSGGSTVQTPPAGPPAAVTSAAARIAELQARIAELKKILISLLRRRVEQLILLLNLLLGR